MLLDKLTKDVEKYETSFQKLDSHLWRMSLALISTAWAAIFAAFRSIIG